MGGMPGIGRCGLLAVSLSIVSVQVPQAQTTDWLSLPPATENLEALSSSAVGDVESPIPEGLTFIAFGDLLRGLSEQTKEPTRGTQEVTIFRQAAPAVVLIKTKDGSGSGIVLQNGTVLTNRHVVEGVGAVQIFFKPPDLTRSAETRTGRVEFVDPRRDLALIHPDSLPPNTKFLRITGTDEFEVGADVYAIGHPLGYAWTFTQGIISGVRAIKTEEEEYTAIQTQTPINPGNSGGPLLNARLEVLGINTWVRAIVQTQKIGGEDVTLSRPAQGLNFAVSAHDLRAFLDDIQNKRITNLQLQLPTTPAGCGGQNVFSGRSKSIPARVKTFSLRCDGVVDAWEIFPDDNSQPIQFHFDPDRRGKSSIVVHSNVSTGKWEVSYWDFFKDRSFAVIGHHDDGKLKPTRFEFSKL
jgi:S1-C subfamily serine protease